MNNTETAKDELKQVMEKFKNSYSLVLKKNPRYRHILDYVMEHTRFLDDPVYTMKTRVYCTLNGVTDLPECQNPACHRRMERRNVKKMDKGFSLYCCGQCRDACRHLQVEKFKKTCLERYGCEAPGQCSEIKEKQRDTLERNYGVRSSPFASAEVRAVADSRKIALHGRAWNNREKARRTVAEKYGVDHVMKVPEVAERRRSTLARRYGAEYPAQIPKVMRSIRDTNVAKYGVPSAVMLEENRKRARDATRRRSFEQYVVKDEFAEPMFDEQEYMSMPDRGAELEWRCRLCGGVFRSRWFSGRLLRKCRRCFKCNGQSKDELAVLTWLKRATDMQVLDKQKILRRDGQYPLEIDVYIPELKFGIEYDGLYMHSLERDFGGTYVIGYHLLKTRLAEQQGIKLVHIRSDQWLSRQNDCKQLVLDLLSGEYEKYIVQQPDGTYRADRSILNKAWFDGSPFGTQRETPPAVLELSDAHGRKLHYESCGELILERT